MRLGIRLTLVLAFAALFAVAPIVRPSPAAAISCDPCPATTTVDLNLRAGPSYSAAVIRVMPAGATVSYGLNQEVDGFVPVTYDGSSGWAFFDYLDVIPPNARITTDWLNLRAGPSLDAAILTVMPPGVEVIVTGGVSGGWVSVTYNGLDGYASAEYLAVGNPDTGTGGIDATVAVDLNLRNNPDLGSDIILVMPAGSSVTVHDSAANGFVDVTYQGIRGWAFADYLNI